MYVYVCISNTYTTYYVRILLDTPKPGLSAAVQRRLFLATLVFPPPKKSDEPLPCTNLNSSNNNENSENKNNDNKNNYSSYNNSGNDKNNNGE